MYEYVLFDLDGTLTDPGIGITNAVIYALNKFSIRVEDRTELYRFIGLPLLDSFQQFYGFSLTESREAIQYYREYYAEKGLLENRVYDEIPELLRSLKKSGRKLLVATSKPEVYAVQILEHFGLLPYFDLVAGASLDESRNCKEDVIRYALQKINGDSAQAVMVGDRVHDVEGAKANGLPVIGVLYGYGSEEELVGAGADLIAKNPGDVIRIIERRPL